MSRAKRRSPVSGIAHHRRQAEGEVGDVRERMGGIDGQRSEHREDPLLEDRRRRTCALVGLEVVPADDLDAFVLQHRAELVGDDVLLRVDQLADAPALIACEQLAGRAAVGTGKGDVGRDLLVQRGDSHLEELVEVGREDGRRT